MQEFVIVIHVLTAVGLVGLILLQQGKGADIGAAFGSGASQTLFGARGSANFLTRTTAILATVFFITSLSLAVLHSRQTEPVSVTSEAGLQKEAPAIPGQDQGAPVAPVAPPTVPALPQVPK